MASAGSVAVRYPMRRSGYRRCRGSAGHRRSSLMANVGISKITRISGVVGVSGSVAVSGPVEVSASSVPGGRLLPRSSRWAVSSSVAPQRLKVLVYRRQRSVAVMSYSIVTASFGVSARCHQWSNDVSGVVGISGPVEVSGIVGVSGSVAISGPVDVSGVVGISGPVEISGVVGVSGSVAVSGPVDVSGVVGISGPVEVSGTVIVQNTSGSPLYVNIFARNTVDSGPILTPVSGGTSGALNGGIWDVLGYNSWTLAVKYSGASGELMNVKLQMAAVSGDENFVDDAAFVNYSGRTWHFFTPNYHVRYARMYYQFSGTSDDGNLLLQFQGEY